MGAQAMQYPEQLTLAHIAPEVYPQMLRVPNADEIF
jgi:hypothetical protein